MLLPGLPFAAEMEPLWEAGAGVGVLSFPDYRGADRQQSYPLTFPYVIYRGDRLKVDREGVRGLFYSTDRADVDVSLDGAAPVDSDQNSGRIGMPDLEPVLEIGPSLNITLSESATQEWRIHLPVRATIIIPTDLSYADHQGWIFNPHLGWRYGTAWNVGGSVGLLYATEGYHDYYYEVSPTFATSTRPAYDAKAGYSGTRVSLFASRRVGRFWFGGFVRYDDLSGATFADSPVMRQHHALMAGVSVAWIFAQSEHLVPAE